MHQVVVTGASGFLGGATLKALRNKGYNCLGITRKKTINFCQVASYQDAPLGEILIHLAETNDRSILAGQDSAHEAEACQTLEMLLSKGYRKVIYASSAALYGDRWIKPRKVTDPVESVDAYTRIKLKSESTVLARGGTVARLANLYGPGMSPKNVISHILDQIGCNKKIIVRSLEPVRDFLWIEDAAVALSSMVENGTSGLFNVGTGVGTSISELIHHLQIIAGTCQSVEESKTLGYRSCIVLDIEDTRRLLGWNPRVRLKEGLQKLIDMRPKIGS